MTAEIISVGTELLLGNILNTNAQYLSRELAALEAEAAENVEKIYIRMGDDELL